MSVNSSLQHFKNMPWGAWCIICLFISVLSGIIVAYQYDPATPFYSATSLEFLVPYGAYFRSLHFYSSQFFFILTLIHLVAIFDQTNNYSRTKWIKLITTIPVALLILFTGYILRGDSTGESAGLIAENIILSIPIAGERLNKLLFSISTDGMKRVYVNHIIALCIFWGILALEHLRKFRVTFSRHIFLTGFVLIFCLVIPAPFEQNKLGVVHIAGPWFFLGLQELLRILSPLLAGVIIPITVFTTLLFLQKKNKGYIPIFIFLLVSLAGYTILTLLALSH